jgi:hypothetical protein
MTRRFSCTRMGTAVAGALMLAVVGCGAEGPGAGDPAVTQPASDPANIQPASATGQASGATAAAEAFTPPSMSAEAEATLRLRAEVDFPNRGFVKFFEPEDGVLLIQEGGRNNQAPLIPQSMGKLGATDLYEALSGQKAPDALVQASARAAALSPRPTATEVTRVSDVDPTKLAQVRAATKGDGVEAVSSALTFSNGYDQWFYDNFCGQSGWDWTVQWMFVTGSGSFTRNDQNFVTSTVSVYGGDAIHYRVRIQPWYSWSTVADVMVQNGYYNRYHRDNGIDFDFNVSVDQASGDSYHWCAYGDSW